MKKSELAKLISESVHEALKEVEMGKAYRWKEEVMSAVQDALYARGDTIDSQAQLEDAIDEEIEKVRQDVEMTLEMIARSLYQVPFPAFKAPKPPSK